jgi:hypothetical protein
MNPTVESKNKALASAKTFRQRPPRWAKKISGRLTPLHRITVQEARYSEGRNA